MPASCSRVTGGHSSGHSRPSWRPKLGERWSFSGRFDIGAGGSDLVWNAHAIIDFQIGKWAAILFGYRHLDYDYSNQNAGITYDASMSGPLFASSFTAT